MLCVILYEFELDLLWTTDSQELITAHEDVNRWLVSSNLEGLWPRTK
mgnify:CR=1 FL=1